MTSLSADFTGCPVLIYNESGIQLGNSMVTHYSRNAMRVELKEIPSPLEVGEVCRLLILSSPSPCEFQGRITREGNKKGVAMFFGQEKENRSSTRYAVSYKAMIENLICDGKAYPLHTPLEATLMNISQSGARFRTPRYSFTDGDRFQMRMLIKDSVKLLIADVVNHIDKDNGFSEYGCRFLIGNERAV